VLGGSGANPARPGRHRLSPQQPSSGIRSPAIIAELAHQVAPPRELALDQALPPRRAFELEVEQVSAGGRHARCARA
jgi:hypothetical protein